MPDTVVIDPVKLGESLRSLRAASGYTQEEAAWECGISQRELSNIERGVYTPRLKTFLTLCALYRVSPNQLALASSEREEVIP